MVESHLKPTARLYCMAADRRKTQCRKSSKADSPTILRLLVRREGNCLCGATNTQACLVIMRSPNIDCDVFVTPAFILDTVSLGQDTSLEFKHQSRTRPLRCADL